MDEGNLILHDTPLAEFDYIWKEYFDFGRNYTLLHNVYNKDKYMADAVAFSPGLRVLKQDTWETLISFILSQNNNIPRIKGMIARLCECFGDKLPCGGYTFPLAGTLAKLQPEDLAVVKAGYRAAYIVDAARRVADGEIDLQWLHTRPSDEVYDSLQKILGVGPKVADCILLYGFGREERYPMDVWMKRVMERWYPNGFPENIQPTAGIAQQYLFHHARNNL